MINWIKIKWNTYLLNKLVNYTGMDLRPEPGVWGIIPKEQEDSVLARIYGDKEIVALLKIYAEIANKALIAAPDLAKAEQFRGHFLSLNGLILKAKRAFKNEQSKPRQSIAR